MKKKNKVAPVAEQTQRAAVDRMHQATALHRQGKLDEAARLYRHIVEKDPSHAEALLWLGVIALQKGDPAAAADLTGRAVTLDPGNATAHTQAGNALRAMSRPEAALASYDRALALKSDYPEALVNRGAVLRDLKRPEEALASFERALALRPAFPEALYNRGNALRDLKRPEEALASYDRALASRPAFAEALANRGSALHDLTRYEEALASHERALALKPALAETLFNRGNTLRELGRSEEALASYDRALTLDPRHVDALNNRGNVLLDLKRYGDAAESFARTLAIAPDHAAAHFNLGACSLLLGDFERGWTAYESRWQYERAAPAGRHFAQPRWSGEYLDGVLLVWAEQGLGDQILFLSMLGDLAKHARALIVAVDARLVPLVRRSFPQVKAVPLDSSTPGLACDAQVPLGSIGRYLRRTWADFPENGSAAYLVADGRRSRELRSRISGGGEVICGLSWISRSGLSGRFKSMTLRELGPVLGMAGTRCVDLQYGDTREERGALEAAARERFVHIEEIDNREDIDGLAALIGSCDVVVTVSNTTAHLAGALGAPVFLMLPYSRGRLWYWHEDRDDSPWYSSVRLFRQTAGRDWSGVIERVTRALAQRFSGRADR